MKMILSLVIVIISLITWYWWMRVIKSGSGHILSGCLPIFGHSLKIIGNNEKLLKVIEDISMESINNGGVARLILGMQTYYVITDPEDLATVGANCIEKDSAFDFAKAWLGDGLITATSSVWKRHKKMLNPAFSLQVLHTFLKVFNAQAHELMDRLTEEVGKGPVDISDYFRETAMKTLSQTALGISGEDARGLFHKYFKAADQILGLIVMRFQNFWLQCEPVYKLLGWKKAETDLISVLNVMTNAVIEEKKSERDTTRVNSNAALSEVKYKAFLNLLLELAADNSVTSKEIREELDTIIIAGTDTSSWLMNYICLALGTYPEVQEKVVAELRQVLGDSDRDLDKDDLQKLVYTEAVIKETLRLYPVAPLSLRYVDTVVKLKKQNLQPGNRVLMSFYGVNRHPVWGTDANQFRPERWLEGEVSPSAFGGFGIGKRNCIGKTFSMMSMKISLSHLLRRYHISGDITKLVLRMDFISKPVDGHCVALSYRQTPDSLSNR